MTTNIKDTTKSQRSVKILLVRHGEREDEAIRDAYWRRQRSRWESLRKELSIPQSTTNLHTAVDQKLITLEPYPQAVDTLDPLLTPKGHEQAQLSFQAIAKALPKQSRVAVFSSPLRRAIGTALMMGTVSFDESIKFRPGPLLDDASSKTTTRAMVPITILNGLGDFAARIKRHGGVNVIQDILRCSSSSSSDTFSKALVHMPSHTCLPCEDAIPVRFCTRDGSPLTNITIDPQTKLYQPETDANKHCEIQRQRNLLAQAKKKSSKRTAKLDPMGAVHEAIRITLSRGCDTCIIVAHREAIRDLKEVCNHIYRQKLPYGCIGSFGATVIGDHDDIRFNYWNSWSLETFGPHSIPKCLTNIEQGLVRVMSTISHDNSNSIPTCICTIDTREWKNNPSLPQEVWLNTMREDSNNNARTFQIEASVVNQQGFDALIQGLVRPMVANRCLVYFATKAYFDDTSDGKGHCERTLRFRFSRRKLGGTRILLLYQPITKYH